MNQIVAVRYSQDNSEITAVKLNNGMELSINDAISLAKQGKILDVNVGAARNGRETLRGYPDGDPSNNLASLPRF